MSLWVIEPGPYSLLVDAGRPRHRALGVSLGGAADRAAWMQGNLLVGNPADSVALEFALAGPVLSAKCDVGGVVFGAPFMLDGERRSGVCFNLSSGETLRIGACADGVRGYLCVPGGFRSAEVLGSCSSFDPIKRGIVLECEPSHIDGRSLAEPIESHCSGDAVIRCLAGPQADWFNLEQFFGPSFWVSPASNRMGLRLNGEPLVRPARELVSEPVCPGTVQVINDGQCIVLGVDGQTIGGYPKVAQVIAADLDRLGQLRPGQIVRFEQVSIEDAELAYSGRQRQLDNISIRLAATR